HGQPDDRARRNESASRGDEEVALAFLSFLCAPWKEVNGWHVSRSSSVQVRTTSAARWSPCARPEISPSKLFSFAPGDRRLPSGCPRGWRLRPQYPEYWRIRRKPGSCRAARVRLRMRGRTAGNGSPAG